MMPRHGIIAIAICLGACVGACAGDAVAPVPAGCGIPNVIGCGVDTVRYTAEVAVRGTTAYTTTWGTRRAIGNKVNVWDVSNAATPVLVDSLIVAGAATLGDAAVSDDGALLVVATERVGGGIVVYDLADPRHPKQLTRYSTTNTNPGVHTAKLARVNGKLYGFLSIDPLGTAQARLVIVDLSVPSAPREVFTKVIGNPYVHDTFIRDGLLFLALWNDGIEIWDIGGGGHGGTPDAPVRLGGVKTLNGEAHNIWWFHDASGGKRFVFVGEEGFGAIGTSSIGDIHVVDVSDMTNPKEVAFFHLDGAGTHNFSMDEKNGVLYAAYYNGGVVALDVHGDLTTCPGAVEVNVPANLTRCDLGRMGRLVATRLSPGFGVYVWGVQYANNVLYASDMLSGLFVLTAAK